MQLAIDERTDLADLLGTLAPEDWQQPVATADVTAAVADLVSRHAIRRCSRSRADRTGLTESEEPRAARGPAGSPLARRGRLSPSVVRGAPLPRRRPGRIG